MGQDGKGVVICGRVVIEESGLSKSKAGTVRIAMAACIICNNTTNIITDIIH